MSAGVERGNILPTKDIVPETLSGPKSLIGRLGEAVGAIDYHPDAEDDGEDINPVSLYLEEIGQFKILETEEQWRCARRIFAGQLALLALRETVQSSLLTPPQKEKISFLFEDKQSLQARQARFLLDHFNNKLVKIAESYVDQVRERLETIEQIETTQLRERTLQEFIDRQTNRLYKGLESYNDLVNTNLRLSVSWAKKYQGLGLSLPELISFGNIGLMIAAAKYDNRPRYRFSTYAVWWIRQAIIRGIANYGSAIRIPAHAKEKLRRYKEVKAQLAQELGYEPSLEDMADELDAGGAVLLAAIKAQQIVSLNEPVGEGVDEFGEFIPDRGPDVHEESFEAERKKALMETLATLPPKEQKVLILRYGLEDGRGRTLEEIGREFNVVRERIRQIEAQALGKLRDPTRAEKLRPYFDEDPKAIRTTGAQELAIRRNKRDNGNQPT